MDAPTFMLLLVCAGALAIGIDAILVVGWRRRREGKPFFHPHLFRWLSGFGFIRRRAAAAGIALWGELHALAVEIRRDELKLLRTALVLGCLLFSASLGYANVHADMVATWLPVAYLLCVVVAAAALAPPTGTRLALNRSDLLVLVPVALAVIVRVIFLETIPSGLHTDEVTTAGFTLRYVYPSTGITYYPLRVGPDTQPALFYSLVRLSLELFGYSIAALRAPSVLAGTLAILTTYALIASWQDRQTALIAALLLSTYHYHVHWSRIALNNIWDTVWIPLILACLIWGWRRSWSGGAILAGLAIGFSQYFYVGSRVAVLLVPYVLYRLWTEDRDARKLMVQTAKMVAAAAVVALPLALFSAANPEIVLGRARLNYTLIPEVLSQSGNSWWAFLRMAAEQSWLALAGLTVLPDRSAFYGPGIPILLGFAALFFLAGLLWALHRRQYLPLLWILITLLFADLLIPGPPHTSHVIGAVPALIWVVALPLRDLARLRSMRLAGALLFLIMLTDLVAYIAVLGTGGGDPAFSVPFPSTP